VNAFIGHFDLCLKSEFRFPEPSYIIYLILCVLDAFLVIWFLNCILVIRALFLVNTESYKFMVEVEFAINSS
jgi:hypothetical protein